MMLIVYSLSLGYLTAKIFCGPHEHMRGVLKSWIIYYKDLKFHVHHWVMGLFFLAFYFMLKYMTWGTEISDIDFAILFFVIGVIVQGIVDYRDWNSFIEK